MRQQLPEHPPVQDSLQVPEHVPRQFPLQPSAQLYRQPTSHVPLQEPSQPPLHESEHPHSHPIGIISDANMILGAFDNKIAPKMGIAPLAAFLKNSRLDWSSSSFLFCLLIVIRLSIAYSFIGFRLPLYLYLDLPAHEFWQLPAQLPSQEPTQFPLHVPEHVFPHPP